MRPADPSATRPYKVLLSLCDQGPGAWDHQTRILRRLHAISAAPLHTLVESPEEAELILISNLRDENWHRGVFEHPLVRRFPDKCFGITDTDYPFPILRGLYTSARASGLYLGRVRGGSYALYPDETKNPFVDGCALDEAVEKRWFLSFIGSNNHPVRDGLLRLRAERDDVLLEDSGAFSVFEDPPGAGDEEGLGRQRRFCEVLRQSKFALCPRGRGRSSVRLFEAMKLGVAPVILSDDWLPPEGPDWGSCSVRVRESEVGNVEAILQEREAEWPELGAAAREAFERYFADEVYFNYVIWVLDGIRRESRVPEVVARWLARGKIWAIRGLRTGEGMACGHLQ